MKTLAEPRRPVESPVVREEGHPLSEVRDAVKTAYPFEDSGPIVIRHVRSKGTTSWYRANWYRQDASGNYIAASRYLAIHRTADGLRVEDQTVQGSAKPSF